MVGDNAALYDTHWEVKTNKCCTQWAAAAAKLIILRIGICSLWLSTGFGRHAGQDLWMPHLLWPKSVSPSSMVESADVGVANRLEKDWLLAEE